MHTYIHIYIYIYINTRRVHTRETQYGSLSVLSSYLGCRAFPSPWPAVACSSVVVVVVVVVSDAVGVVVAHGGCSLTVLINIALFTGLRPTNICVVYKNQ